MDLTLLGLYTYKEPGAECIIKMFGALSSQYFWLLIQISAGHVINEGLGSRENRSQSLVTGHCWTGLPVIKECVCLCVCDMYYCRSLRESVDI